MFRKGKKFFKLIISNVLPYKRSFSLQINLEFTSEK